MSLEKLLNTTNLRIARENAGYTTMEATNKVAKNKHNNDRVKEWEAGKSVPTHGQLNKLAKDYGINVFLLSIPETMNRNRKIKDYRTKREDVSTLNEKKFINLLLQRQRYISDILRKENHSKNELVDSIKQEASPQTTAKNIREKLDYQYDGKSNHLKYFIGLLEKKGVFVMKTLSYWKIPVNSMRGVYLNDEYAPLIALNRSDSKTAQLFTLAHEVVHLFLKSEGISNIDFRAKSNDKTEVLCNKIAANILLPAEELQKEYKKYYAEREAIEGISKKYQVSRIFVYHRLVNLELISPDPELEAKIIKETGSGKDDDEKSGGNYLNNVKDSNGYLYNNFISALYFEGEISPVEAGNLLKIGVDQVD